MHRLNQIAGDPAQVEQMWRCFCHDRWGSFRERLLAGAGLAKARVTGLLKRGLRERAPHCLGAALTAILARFATGRHTRQKEIAGLCNLLRCPAHHERMTTIIEMQLGEETPSPAAWEQYQELIQDCRPPGWPAGPR
jgi:hypothetical protein